MSKLYRIPPPKWESIADGRMLRAETLVGVYLVWDKAGEWRWSREGQGGPSAPTVEEAKAGAEADHHDRMAELLEEVSLPVLSSPEEASEFVRRYLGLELLEGQKKLLADMQKGG